MWALLTMLGFQLALGVIESAHPGAVSDLVTIGACSLLAHLVVLFGLLRLHAPEASVSELVALRRPPLAMIPLAALVGAGISPAASWINGLLEKRFPLAPEETEVLEKIFRTDTAGQRVALVVVLMFVMPLCDELFYRGALFTTLKKSHKLTTVIAATAAFDALVGSGNVRGIGPTLALAWMLGALRAASDSMIVPLIASMAFFAVDVVPMALGRGEPTHGWAVIAGGVVVSSLALAVTLRLGKRRFEAT